MTVGRARDARESVFLRARRHEAPAEERPDLWFTYHVYYKAPDWLGPSVSEALGIPYVIARRRTRKRAGGRGHRHAAAAAAIARARLVISPRDDLAGLRTRGADACTCRCRPRPYAAAAQPAGTAPGLPRHSLDPAVPDRSRGAMRLATSSPAARSPLAPPADLPGASSSRQRRAPKFTPAEGGVRPRRFLGTLGTATSPTCTPPDLYAWPAEEAYGGAPRGAGGGFHRLARRAACQRRG
jgi:hypothetical protein